MSDFVDIEGASGARYRFRRTSFAGLPVTAGNLLAVTRARDVPRVRICATARSLARAAPALREALAGVRGATLYIRLNVGRAQREAEHADIVAAARPEQALSDLG